MGLFLYRYLLPVSRTATTIKGRSTCDNKGYSHTRLGNFLTLDGLEPSSDSLRGVQDFRVNKLYPLLFSVGSGFSLYQK